jgi:hypothetical protein
MYKITAAWLEWKELRNLAMEINECLPDFYGDGNPTINCRTRGTIYQGIKETFDQLEEIKPDWRESPWRESRPIPARAIEFYESIETEEERRDGRRGHWFLKVPQWFVKDGYVADLTPPELKVLIVLGTFAYFGDGLSEQGMEHGETFVGRKKIAEVTGLSVASIDRILASLTEKGHIESRWIGKNKVVRKVMFMLAEI